MAILGVNHQPATGKEWTDEESAALRECGLALAEIPWSMGGCDDN